MTEKEGRNKTVMWVIYGVWITVVLSLLVLGVVLHSRINECERHDGMHINMENVYVEFVDPNGDEVLPGKEGAIVVTSLYMRMSLLYRMLWRILFFYYICVPNY